jgi:hypothetical protein
MAFSPGSEQIDFGIHIMVIDHDERKVRIFSQAHVLEEADQRDWEAVSAKLRELGVTTLSEPDDEHGSDATTDVAEGTF